MGNGQLALRMGIGLHVHYALVLVIEHWVFAIGHWAVGIGHWMLSSER